MPRIGDAPMQSDQAQTAAIKTNSIGKLIEAQKPFWKKDGKREYHTFSREWIANEIFRRLEPKGRTMAEYIK